MKKILIFEAASKQALSISKFIKQHSTYYLVGYLEDKSFIKLPYFDEVRIGTYTDVSIDEYDFVLPMGAISTYSILNTYDKLKFCNNIIFESRNLMVFDKPNMLKIVEKLNIPIPKTVYDKSEIDEYPVFYKDNFECGGGTRGIAKSFQEIPDGNHLLFQEYINTPSTYAFGYLAVDGVIKTWIIYKEVISYPYIGGASVVIEDFYDARIFDYSNKIIKKLNYNGWGLIEYKYSSKHHDYVFMEVNAKFWASIEYTLINNPMFLRLLLDIKYLKSHTPRIVFLSRFVQYDIVKFFKYAHYIYSSTIVYEEPLSYQILKKIIPKKVYKKLKRIFIK